MKFCSDCGEKVVLKVPEGDSYKRSCCPSCGTIHYINPKIIAGSLIYKGNEVLLAKRAIGPRENFWTIPAGFLELKESTQEGAIREVMEEANAEIDVKSLLAVIDIVHISQVYIIYLSELKGDTFSPGPESLDVRLFKEEDIPWDDLAFESIKETLRFYFKNLSHYKEGETFENYPILRMTIDKTL